MKPPASAWVAFCLGKNRDRVRSLIQGRNGGIACYEIERVVSIKGEIPSRLDPGWNMLRIENSVPIRFSTEALLDSTVEILHGVTKHHFYTHKDQRELLNQRSCLPPASGIEKTAVLIPITKSAEWWQMAQDERQAHFQRQSADREGHTDIGLRYADKIFRKLYHCRYSETQTPYDFLTYFEFCKSDSGDFMKLLENLRDPKLNPEWSYVTSEFEIWLNPS